MIETDDRLVGDPVWELFPSAPAQVSPGRRYRAWAGTAALIVASWFVFPPLAVLFACLAASSKEFRAGWRMARTIPDKAGGRICTLFAYAWGVWKLGSTAFVLIFVTAILAVAQGGKPEEMPLASMTASLLWMGGFLAAAALTAVGLVRAYRAGMRVWIGEGVNQARTLLLGMLMAGVVVFVIMPLCFWLTRPRPVGRDHPAPAMVAIIGIMFGGPVALLILLDWFTRHIVAERPGKFGSKVPTLGKWDGGK